MSQCLSELADETTGISSVGFPLELLWHPSEDSRYYPVPVFVKKAYLIIKKISNPKQQFCLSPPPIILLLIQNRCWFILNSTHYHIKSDKQVTCIKAVRHASNQKQERKLNLPRSLASSISIQRIYRSDTTYCGDPDANQFLIIIRINLLLIQ